MTLIKNQDELNNYIKEHYVGEIPTPKEFPCYAYLVGADFMYERSHHDFLYLTDLNELVSKLKEV